jgi:LysM repeat protein
VATARLWLSAAVLAGLAVIAAGCGSDKAEPTGTLPPIVTTTSTTTTTTIAGASLQTFYVVKQGDTLSKIAHSFGVSQQALMEVNGIQDPNHVEIGQRLEIPPPTVVVDQLPPPSTTVAATPTVTSSP